MTGETNDTDKSGSALGGVKVMSTSCEANYFSLRSK